MARGVHYPNVAVLTALLAAGFLLAAARLFYLQILRHDDLGEEAAQLEAYRQFPRPWRGQIRARHGETLVFSQPCRNIYANLNVSSNRLEECARVFATSLQLDQARLLVELQTALAKRGDQELRQALCIKRNATEAEWQNLTNSLAQDFFSLDANHLSRSQKKMLKRLRSSAVFAEEDQVRLYTSAASSLGPVLGFTGLNREGQLAGLSGIEQSWNRELAGTRGILNSKKNASGQELAIFREVRVPALDGNDVVLTIDPYLQDISAKALAKACERCTPSNATVLIVQPHTGEILSWVSWPFLDPNNPRSRLPEASRNYGINEHFEPGSTFKMITLAAALNENLTTLDQQVDGEQGRLRRGNTVLRDRQAFGLMNVREATAQSVNVVFAKLGMSLGPERFLGYITNFGFGQTTGIPLPRESAGLLPAGSSWSTLTQTRVSIGQGIASTPLQMAMGACALGNQGKRLKPMLVKSVINSRGQVLLSASAGPGQGVVTPQTARLVLEALTEVTSSRGTARAAALETHQVAGKTGTAQVANGQGYLPGCYYASFIGLVPALEPQLCILVAFTSPKNGHTGGGLAAPVFKEIAQKAVIHLGIKPDKLP